MTIIPRVRGSLALSCCFAKQPLLSPIWESDCRSSCLIQVFIFIASLYTSTTWVLQVAVIYIASCLLLWEWSGEQRHPILKRRSIFWLVEEDILSTEGLTQRISFAWCEVTHYPTGIPHSAVEPGLVPGRMEEEGGHSAFVPCVVLVCAEPEPWLAPAPHPQHQLPTGTASAWPHPPSWAQDATLFLHSCPNMKIMYFENFERYTVQYIF